MPTLIVLLLLGVLLIIVSPSVRKLTLRDMITLSVFIAIASVGRYLLAAIPSVQPTSFFVMIAGTFFGPGAGFITGLLSALVSNMLLGGISYYTPWQMLLWSLMGLSGAFLGKNRIVYITIGFIWGFVFGFVMNYVWYTIGNVFSWQGYLAACIASLQMDLTHAVTNAVLLASLLPVFQRIFKNLHKNTV